MNLYVDISYDIVKRIPWINTNLKVERVDDFLNEYIRTQIGKGEDMRVAVDRDIYNIRIDCDLRDDTFTTWSDTGNHSLRDGLVIATIGNWRIRPIVVRE